VLASLGELADRLPQALRQVARMLQALQSAGCVDIDRGTEWDGNPAGAVDAAARALLGARQAAHILGVFIDAAQQAIAAASYRDPEKTNTVVQRSTSDASEIEGLAERVEPA
jgi:hypothetical protein